MNQNHGRKFCILICFFVLSHISFAQQTKLDSLKAILETAAQDSSKVKILNALSVEVLNGEDIEGSLLYSKQANELAGDIDYKKGKAYALKNIGLAEYFQGNFDQVLEYWTNSLETFETIQDTLGIANMVNNLGAVYYSQSAYAKATDYYLRSLSISEKLQDPFRIATALVNIGGAYSDGIEDHEKAFEYYNKLEPLLEQVNDNQITTAYLLGIGEVNEKQGNFDKALEFYNEAMKLNLDNRDEATHIQILEGKVQVKIGDYAGAEENLTKAYKTAKEDNQQLQIVQALLVLGEIYQKNNFKKALETYNEAESLAKEISIPKELIEVYKGISDTYRAKGDYTNAYDFQSRYLVTKDSIFNLETNDKIRGLQFNFDLEKKQDEIGLLEKEAEINELQEKRQKAVSYISLIVAGGLILFAIGLYRRYKYMQKTKLIIEEEKTRSDNLLLNILPEETALELKQSGKVKAKKFEAVTVLFTDFKSFTHYAEVLSPEKLVESVDFYFSKFDEIMEKYNLEKIKTVGDAYMCAGGLHTNLEDHALKMLLAALEMTEFVSAAKEDNEDDDPRFDVRIGLNSGPIVAGVVGTHKFAYDIWGDTVNVASRMESNSEPGKINISENTYMLVKDHFNCEYRGEYEVKNRGMMKMYYVTGRKSKKATKGEERLEVEA